MRIKLFMKAPAHLVLASLILGLPAGSAWATSSDEVKIPFDRDATYERDLAWENSADKTVTPAKVMRWITSLRGQAPVSAPSSTEFQPIVNAHDGQVRLIAAIAYKF
jgi:hypothetical protein